MRARMEVFALGKGRAGVFGVKQGCEELKEIQSWLSQRSDVERIEHRTTSETLVVFYRDSGSVSGRLLRALRDQVHLLQKPTVAEASEEFQVKVVHSLPGRVRFRVEGLVSKEIGSLTSFASLIPGVKKTDRLPESRTLLVFYDAQITSESLLLEALRKCRPTHLARFSSETGPHLRLGNAMAGTAVLVACLSQAFSMPLMAVGISLVSIRPLRRSLRSIVEEGKFSIDALDVAATFAALATGRPITAAFIIWMEGVGDLLLDVSANSARNALTKLVRDQDREVCRVKSDGLLEYISAEDLKVGDQCLFQTGHPIAVDGRVVRGWAEVDEKALTGESHLVSKRENDRVLASTVIVEGQLVVEVQVLAQNTEAAKIEQVLGTVGNKPLTLQREALEFGGKLVPPTFGMAGFAAAAASNLTPAVCVLVTDFGTGIRISVPTSALTAMNLAARENILVKGAQYLERLSKTDVVIFDKTGTLTSGVPEVVDVVLGKGMDEKTLIFFSTSAEARQDHPVAKALKSYAKKSEFNFVEPDPETDQHSVGRGHSARVGGRLVQVGRATWMDEMGYSTDFFATDLQRLKNEQTSSICVAVDGEVIGLIGYSDGSRPESAAIIEKLKGNGRRRVILLSGDSPEVVRKVAQEVGIEEAVGALLPDQKADYVRRLKGEGHVVAMIGDGINDAPALALADVGISIAGSTEVALETADIILLDGGLSRLPKAFSIADKTMIRVKRNLGVVVVPNAIAIVLGALGLLSPPAAALINNGSTLAAVLCGTFPLLFARDRRQLKLPVDTDKAHKLALDVPSSKVTRIYPKGKKPHKTLDTSNETNLHISQTETKIRVDVVEEKQNTPLANTPQNGLFARFEEKFFLPKANAERFKAEIQATFKRSCFVPGTVFTDIESIYLDSPDFVIYRMHFSGAPERFKIRARKYAPNGVPVENGTAHIEYKSKKEGVSRKSRFQVGPKEFGRLWNGKKIPAVSKSIQAWNQDLKERELKSRVKWINHLVSSSELKPTCIVKYRREAFETDNELRLTIDDQIRFEKIREFADSRGVLDQNPEVQSGASKMRSAFKSGEFLLVEVKHPGTIPPYLLKILEDNQCTKAKFSKYCYSVTEALLDS